MSTTGLQHGAGEIGWLVSRFVEETAEVADAIVVSSDGLLLAISPNLDRTAADKLAAIVSGLRSLSEGVSAVTGRGGFSQAMIELADGYLVVSAISDGSSIGVVAARNADLGAVGYGTTLLVERVGAALTPALIDELKLGLEARELYPTLAGELLETTGVDIGLWQEGIAAVAATEAEAAELRARCAWQRQQGHLGDWLDAEEVRSRWPCLARRSERSSRPTRAPSSRPAWSKRSAVTPSGSARRSSRTRSRGWRRGAIGSRAWSPGGAATPRSRWCSRRARGRRRSTDFIVRSPSPRFGGRWPRCPGPRTRAAPSSTVTAATSSREARRRSSARRWSSPAIAPR